MVSSREPPNATVDQTTTAPRLRVLVVEDDPDSASSLSLLLGLEGHEVRLAGDGRAALRVAHEWAPDVAFLDIGLPGEMDGFEVARQLGELPGPKKPLLVAITGHANDDDRRRSEAAGIHLHLPKPADPDLLQRMLRRFKGLLAD